MTLLFASAQQDADNDRELSVRFLPLFVLLAGCAVDPSVGADPAPALDPSATIIHDDVVVLDDTCLADVDVPEDRGVLTFTFDCDPSDLGIEPGRIVVGSAGGGYLRRVVDVDADGWSLRVTTEEASLAEAVVQGGLSLQFLESNEERSLINFSNTTLYEGEVAGADVRFLLRRGILDLGGAVDVDGHWSEGSVERFDFDTDFTVRADLEAEIRTSEGVSVTKNLDVWETSWPFATAIGPMPVVGHAGLRAKVGARADTSGRAVVSAGASGHTRLHTDRMYRRDQGWSEDPRDDVDWNVHPPAFDVDAVASGRVYVRLELFVTFYGSAGPELSTDLYSKFTASPDCEGIDYSVDAGLHGAARVKMNILDRFKPTKTFGTFDLTADLMEDTLPWPVGVPLPCAQPTIRCGDVVEGDTTGGSAQLNGYSCNVGSYAAPESIFEWRADRSGPVELRLRDAVPTEVNHDLMVLEGNLGLITGQCSDWGANSVTFEAVEGRTYFLAVDGYDQDAGAFTLELDCG